jgi:large subunit ribosomal protein L29
MQSATGQLTDHARLKLIRRDIARLSTIMRERELAAALQGSEQ